MKNGFLKVQVNTQKTILSSESIFYKTENFIKKTKYISNIDFFLSKLAETIIFNADKLTNQEKLINNEINCFNIQTSDDEFPFLFKFGYQVDGGLNKNDIVFFDCLIDQNTLRQNDQRINNYVNTHSNFQVVIKKEKTLVKMQDFSKLYLLSNLSGVNLPKLSKEQKEIVETVDRNVLVQGVAGSGKTNICIDKIIFTACKNYSGDLLYTTFSRGLLIDTKIKVETFAKELEQFVEDYNNKKVVFLDNDHKKSLENKFGIFFFSEDDDKIIAKIKSIIFYLKNKVDYFLIDDIYKTKNSQNFSLADEQYFIKNYIPNIKNHNIAKSLKRVEKYSYEVLFKEINGMIFGFCDFNNPQKLITEQQYINYRKDSFSGAECQSIYAIAIDYKKHCQNAGLVDINTISRQILNDINAYKKYSLAIIDEVQDYSQISLYMLKKLSLKLVCVGDALQMINPSYFSFGYLKNLLYDKDLTSVKELSYNYRNTKKIEEIITDLTDINKSEFGTHKFVIKGKAIDSGLKTNAVFVADQKFVDLVAKAGFDNFTFVVSNQKQKIELKKTIKNQEVLTVSEIKGLERNTVVLYNILSDNIDKWYYLEKTNVNRKLADENSVYRYYYNLFYVGLSRAKQNIFVLEKHKIKTFEGLFKKHFEFKNPNDAISSLNNIIGKVEFTEKELLERVQEFIKLEQFDNAKFTANKIKDDKLRIDEQNKISVYQNFVHFGKYREAGVKFWEYGLLEEAKKQFTISGDQKLIELLVACSESNNQGLNIDIVEYFEDVKDNKIAQSFIVETIRQDVKYLKQSFKEIRNNYKTNKK